MSLRLSVREECPVSAKVIVDMLTRAKRLAPLCRALSALGAASPCEDEESLCLLLVNTPTNEVSERGLKMPFIE